MNAPRIAIHEGELARIGAHVVDRRRRETGGELYGFLTPTGTLVIQLASGPGPRARHGDVSFHQDADFLRAFFRAANDGHLLQHIGSWHSHHGLSLAEPSTGDDRTMARALEVSKLPYFLLVIANLVDDEGNPDSEGSPEVRAFLYFADEPRHGVPCDWHLLPADSPIRIADAVIRQLDATPVNHPVAPVAVNATENSSDLLSGDRGQERPPGESEASSPLALEGLSLTLDPAVESRAASLPQLPPSDTAEPTRPLPESTNPMSKPAPRSSVDELMKNVPDPHRGRGVSASVGAAVGATLGSVVGGVPGAAIGAAAGGAIGVAVGESLKKGDR
jgi:hypothetical protein